MSVSTSSNFFEVFGLSPVFDLDLEHVGERYREMQRQYHPDRFVNEDSAVRRQAIQLAAHVNQAHDTLKDPLQRARYLLSMISTEDDGEHVTSADPGFLMTQMELRERLEELASASDPLAEADSLKRELKQDIELIYAQLSDRFKSNEVEKAKELVVRLQFFHRLLDSVKEEEARLEDELF